MNIATLYYFFERLFDILIQNICLYYFKKNGKKNDIEEGFDEEFDEDDTDETKLISLKTIMSYCSLLAFTTLYIFIGYIIYDLYYL